MDGKKENLPNMEGNVTVSKKTLLYAAVGGGALLLVLVGVIVGMLLPRNEKPTEDTTHDYSYTDTSVGNYSSSVGDVEGTDTSADSDYYEPDYDPGYDEEYYADPDYESYGDSNYNLYFDYGSKGCPIPRPALGESVCGYNVTDITPIVDVGEMFDSGDYSVGNCTVRVYGTNKIGFNTTYPAPVMNATLALFRNRTYEWAYVENDCALIYYGDNVWGVFKLQDSQNIVLADIYINGSDTTVLRELVSSYWGMDSEVPPVLLQDIKEMDNVVQSITNDCMAFGGRLIRKGDGTPMYAANFDIYSEGTGLLQAFKLHTKGDSTTLKENKVSSPKVYEHRYSQPSHINVTAGYATYSSSISSAEELWKYIHGDADKEPLSRNGAVIDGHKNFAFTVVPCLHSPSGNYMDDGFAEAIINCGDYYRYVRVSLPSAFLKNKDIQGKIKEVFNDYGIVAPIDFMVSRFGMG